MIRINLAILLTLLDVTASGYADEVTFKHKGSERTMTGEVVVETQDGKGLLFESTDGKLWAIQPDKLREKKIVEPAVKPLSRKELGKQLKQELGNGFKIHEAGSFVIAFNTEVPYARWVAGLYRKLERGFDFYWTRNKFKLQNKPPFPLPVIIFKSQEEYHRYMKKDLGVVSSMLAYYSLESNRVVMFDLTAGNVQPGAKLNERRINEVLDNPRAIPMVATVIHEGTHQLMFNYGMQTRFADTPLWINEGLATYFETPDLGADRGWRTIGKINYNRLSHFLKYLPNRPADSLQKMLRSDDGFRNEEALDNYAQSWAFNYFLLNRRKKAYVKYLKHMSKKPRLIYDKPEQRVKEFLDHFDTTLEKFDEEFLQYIRKLR